MKASHTAIALLLLAALGTAHAETVWKWSGPDGKPVYGKEPPKGVKAEQVDVRTSKLGTFAPAGTASATAPAAPAGKPAAKAAPAAAATPAANVGNATQPRTDFCPPELPICKKKGNSPNSPPQAQPEMPKNEKGVPLY